jgi:hypothetical protein
VAEYTQLPNKQQNLEADQADRDGQSKPDESKTTVAMS